MDTQLVTDYSGEPVAMVIDYKDWVEIASRLNIPLAPSKSIIERNPLDWYTVTESANSVLTGVIAMASRERMKEQRKAKPDTDRIAYLTNLQDEVIEINNNALNFKSLERMEELIKKYSPILSANKSNSLKR